MFARSEPWVERLVKRGLIMARGDRYRLLSSVFGPWILRQIAAEFSEEQSYQEWLAQNGLAERFTGKHAALREILPEDRCPLPPAHHHLGERPADLHRHGRPAQGHPDPGALSETTMDPQPHVNPYIAGSPITGTEMFYGRADVFSFITRNLTGLHRDTPIVLYGQRRTGKTSVLYQLHRHLDPRYRCIFIDLHGLSLDGMGNLLHGIANTVSRGPATRPSAQSRGPRPVVVPGRPAVGVRDQVPGRGVVGAGGRPPCPDDGRGGPPSRGGPGRRLDREIFEFLRHLMQHFTRLNFIFSLGSGLEEMAKDYAFLFSVSLYRRISFLEPAAARELITRPVRRPLRGDSAGSRPRSCR